MEIRSEAVDRVWKHAQKLGVNPEKHLARWVEAVSKEKVKKVEIIFDDEMAVGVRADV